MRAARSRGIDLIEAPADATRLAASLCEAGEDWRASCTAPALSFRPGAEAGTVSLTHDGRPLFEAWGARLHSDTVRAALAGQPPGALDDARESGSARDFACTALATDLLFNARADTADGRADLLSDALRLLPRQPTRTVSIILTCHNYARFVDAAIDSALAQTHPAEVIAVDDGSTDGCADIIARREGITPVLKANGGQASAMNAGLAEASGDLVLFLDADDILHPGAALELASADLRGAARVSFMLETIDAYGRPLGLYDPAPDGPRPPSGHLAGAVMSDGIAPFMPTSGNAFAREALGRLMPMPEPSWRICADLYLTLATAPLGDAVMLDAVLGAYRIHGRNAYYERLGAGLHKAPARLARRKTAWAQLADHPAIPGDAFRQALRALASDTTANPPPGDLLTAAGRSAWPRVPLCEEIDLTDPRQTFAGCGRGISLPHEEGRTVVGNRGVLALRLPRLGCDFALTLGLHADGPLCAKVLVHGNEAALIEMQEAGFGERVIDIPAALLVPWQEVVPDGLADADSLFLEIVPDEGAGELSMSRLRVDPLPSIPPPYPALLAGAWSLPEPALGRGWGWPHADRVPLKGSGMLHLTAAGRGAHQAIFALIGVPSGESPAVRLQGHSPAVRTRSVETADGALTLAIADLPVTAASRGRLTLELCAPKDAVTGRPREIALLGLSLYPLGGGALVPYRRTAAGAMAARGRGENLLAAGEDAHPERAVFALRLDLPAAAQDRALLVFADNHAETPLKVAFSLCGCTTTALIGASAAIMLDVPAGCRPEALRAETARPEALVLRALELHDPPPSRPLCPAPPVGPGAAHDPARLQAAEDALWLGASCARFALTLPEGCEALDVGLITLADPAQTLCVRHGAHSARTDRAGPQTLTIPVDRSCAPLVIETDTLVDGALLGLSDGIMLGGAVTSIEPVKTP